MRKVSYLFLVIGLAFLLLSGCRKPEIETEGYEVDNVKTTTVPDNPSVTEKAEKDEILKDEETESDK